MSLKPLRIRIVGSVRRGERGASAIVVALLMTVIMAAGALGLDIAKLVFERQQVRAAVDAAAQIGAARLSSAALGIAKAGTLVTDIRDAAAANYGDTTYGPGLNAANVSVAFFCVVANTSGSSATVSPNTAQIPSTCNPTGANYTTNTKCSATSCAIPCSPTTEETAVCNAVRVSASKVVQYVLAPAINIDHGYAAASTVSCQGSCGGDAPPNPLNVVVMADRTPSMFNEALAGSGGGNKDLSDLRAGMLSMLKFMNTDQQYLAFGAIQKSVPKVSAGNLTTPPPASDYTFANTKKTNSCEWWGCTDSFSHTGSSFTGSWVPGQFSNNYIYKDSAGVAQWTTTSDIYTSMANLTYSNLTSSDGRIKSYFTQADGLSGNTHLASALKGAARFLLDKSHNNINALDTATNRPSIYGPAEDVIIFETDGSPAEVFNYDPAAALKLDNADDVGNKDGGNACSNFKTVAEYAKAAGITIITIGFGDASKADTKCENGGTPVKDVLAEVASKKNGMAASANNDCTDTSTGGGVFKENNDGDNYFCAASGPELKKVFEAALGNVSGGTKFMAIDGIGD